MSDDYRKFLISFARKNARFAGMFREYARQHNDRFFAGLAEACSRNWRECMAELRAAQ